MDLNQKQCVPCEGGMAPLNAGEIRTYLSELEAEWEVVEGKMIRREFVFKTFRKAVLFAGSVADLAEEEKHHPNIHIFYRHVIIELTTHAIGGLSENDFIMAAKINTTYG